MSRPAFTLIEVVLYSACVAAMIPMVAHSVRILRAMETLCRSTHALMLHRRAYGLLQRDIMSAHVHQESDTKIVCQISVGESVAYHLRSSGIYRLRERVVHGQSVKSSAYLAPPGAQIMYNGGAITYSPYKGVVWQRDVGM